MVTCTTKLFVGDPVMTTVLLRARDGGSMHRLRYLDEAVRLHRYFRKNISALYRESEESEAEQIRYVDICGPFCDANIAIEYFAVRSFFLLITTVPSLFRRR